MKITCKKKQLKKMKPISYVRNARNEISITSLDNKIAKEVISFVARVDNSGRLNGYDNWKFDKNFCHNGDKLNCALLAIGYDYHSKKLHIAIQIRQFRVHKAVVNVRNAYLLLGLNQDKSLFVHPVERRVIQSAIKNNKDVIYALQSWMYGVDYKKITRLGKFAIIEVPKPKGEKILGDEIYIKDSISFIADEIYRKSFDLYYAKTPHLLDCYNPLYNNKWYKVILPKKCKYWNFPEPNLCFIEV